MLILGVDPGIRGGLAIVLVATNGVAPQLVDAIDIPVIGVGAKERVDPLAIRDWLAPHAPQHAFIERAQAMPRQGASSGFKYGRAITELTKLGIDMKLLRPAAADEQLRCQQQLLALWPEACARAGVAVIDMPTEVLRAVAAVTGRPH